MFCPNCGSQNDNNSKFCCNCANSLASGVYADDSKKKAKKKIFSAHILNIVSAVVLILSFLLIYFMANAANMNIDKSVDGNNVSQTTITVNTGGAQIAYIAICIGAAIVALGILAYFVKKKLPKAIFAYIYFFGALLLTCLQFFAGICTSIFTCGLGFVLIASGILQIVAGSKFVSALKYV